MNLKEFIVAQSRRAGVDESNEEFRMLISASALNDIEIPSGIVNKFNSNLFDSDLAKSNLDLKTHFIRNYMEGYDEEIIKMSKDYGLPLEAVDEIKTAKNSGDKVKLAFKHLKDLEEVAKKNSSRGQSDEYVKKIAEAQAKLDEAVAKSEAVKSEVEAKYVNKMKSLYEQAQLSGIQWNDNIPEIARLPVFNAAKEAKLKALGGITIYDPESNTNMVRNANDISLPLVVDGKEFSYSDLSSVTLQENKLLKEIGNSGSNPVNLGTQFNSANFQQSQQGTRIPSHISAALAEMGKTANQANSQQL
jgi:hypothetical protein